jgi:hypothetical protein
MRNVFFSLFAIGLAGIAAMAATTAVLNAPVRPSYIGPAKSEQPAATETSPPASGEPAPSSTPAPEQGTPPATPPSSPAETSAPAAAASAAESDVIEADQDPYGDVAEEELPPDLQYDADSSVSFPTNI